jgi:hypothetical protein
LIKVAKPLATTIIVKRRNMPKDCRPRLASNSTPRSPKYAVKMQ